MMCQLADAGMVGCTVMLDKGKANEMVKRGVKYTTFRHYDSEDIPNLSGQKSDMELGFKWWSDCKTGITTGLDQRVYIQPSNERNIDIDAWYWLGVQMAAAQDGWKLSIKGDGVGNPKDFREEPPHSGRYVSETWSRLVDTGCLPFGKRAGNLLCLHQYGRCNPDGSGTPDPGSAIWPDGHTDEGAYFWYGGRHRSVYDKLSISGDCRMLVDVGECGPSDAVYRGSAQVINELNGYETRYGPDPDIAVYKLWTVGGDGGGPRPNGNYKFAYSTLDNSLPDILAWLKQRKP